MLNKYQSEALEMLSNEIADGKRGHEVVLLDLLYHQNTVTHERYIEELQTEGYTYNTATIDSVKRVLDLEFFTKQYQNKYGNIPIVFEKNGVFEFNEQFKEYLDSDSEFNKMIEDLLLVAKSKIQKYDRENPLTLYEKYTRKDVCKLLEWDKDESSTMFGYKTKHGTCPIFITYDKEHDIESSVNYGDEFINDKVLHWYTRSNRTLRSQEVQKIIESAQHGIDLHIFVKKDNDEGTDFYYLGKADPDLNSVSEDQMTNDKGKTLPVVTMDLNMENAIEHKLFHYLTTTNTK